MAEDIATLGIEARTHGVQQAARELQQLEAQGRRTEGAATSLTGSLSGLGAALTGLGVAAAARQLVNAADEMANIESRIKLVTKSSAELARVQAELFQRSQETQTSFRANAELYVSMARATDGLGVSQQRLLALTDGIGKAFIVSGAGAAESSTAIRQLGQALQSGTLRGDEFNSMAENAPRLMQALADGLGVARGELRRWAEDGRLTTETILPALEKGLRSVDGEFAQMPATISRATTALKNSFDQWASDVNKQSGLNAGLAASITAIADNFSLIADGATVAAAAVAGKYVGSIATATAAKVSEVAASIRAAQAEAALLVVRKEHVAMLLAEAQASAATAVGMQRLAIVQAQVVPLQQRLATATAAAAAAQAAAVPGMTLASGAMAALGGPIGLVTTALTVGATAWMLWGNKAQASTKQAADAAAENIKSVIDKLAEMNDSIGRFSRKQAEQGIQSGMNALQENAIQMDKAVSNIRRLKAEIDLAQDRGYSQSGIKARNDELLAQQVAYQTLLANEKKLQADVGRAREQAAQAGANALDQFIRQSATAEQKLAKDREELVAGYMAVIKQTSADGAFDASNASHVAALKQLGLAMKEVEKKNKDATDAQRLAREEAERLKATLMEGFGLQPDFYEDWERLSKLFASGAMGKGATAVDALAEAQARLLEKQPAVRAGTQAQTVADKAAEKAIEERTKALRDAVTAEFDRASGLKAGAAQMREELETLGMTSLQLAQYEASKYTAAAAAEELAASNLEEAAATAKAAGASDEAVDHYLALAKARREAAAALNDKAALVAATAAKQTAIDAMQQATDAQVAMWQSIDQTAHDTFVSIFDSGKDVFERLTDTLKNTLYDLLYQMTVKRWLINISAAVSGQGVAQQAFGMAGGNGGIFDMAQQGYGLYNYGSQAYNWLTGTSAAYGTAAAAGGMATTGALGYGASTIGGSGLVGGVGSSTFMAGGTSASAAMGGTSIAAGGTAAASGGMLSTVAAAAPYVAIALMALYALGAFDGPSPHVGSATFTDFDGAQRQLKHEEQIGSEQVWGGFKGNDALTQPLNMLAADVTGTIEGAFEAFGSDRQVSAFAAFGSDDNDPSRGILRLFNEDGSILAQNTGEGNAHRGVKYDDDPTVGFQEFAADAGRVVRDALVAADLPSWVDGWLQDLGDEPSMEAVKATVAQAGAVKRAAETLGPALGITAEGLAGVIDQTGSFDAAMQGLSAYADQALTSSEKWLIQQNALADGFDELGVAVPKSTDEFRRLMDGLDLTTEADQALYGSLLMLAPAFYTVAGAVEDAFDSISRSTADLVQKFQMDVMTDSERYAYFYSQIAILDAKIDAATDPTELAALIDERNQALLSAWNLLTDEQKAANLQTFTDIAMDGESSAQARLSVTPIDSPESEAKRSEKIAEEAQKTREAITTGIANGMERVAEMFTTSSGNLDAAAAKLRESASELRASVGGGFSSGGEVVFG